MASPFVDSFQHDGRSFTVTKYSATQVLVQEEGVADGFRQLLAADNAVAIAIGKTPRTSEQGSHELYLAVACNQTQSKIFQFKNDALTLSQVLSSARGHSAVAAFATEAGSTGFVFAPWLQCSGGGDCTIGLSTRASAHVFLWEAGLRRFVLSQAE